MMLRPPISTLFPYTTLFRSTMSLLDAGVPLKDMVSGIAMGLIHEGGQYVTLTDILGDRKSTRLNSSHLGISYAVFCLKKKKTQKHRETRTIRKLPRDNTRKR